MKKEQNQKAQKDVPFFARFLEGQRLKVKAGVKAGATTKYPSDNDEFFDP